ncbi:MAG: HDIG domain-containing protein [Cyanobacteria bacterium SIG31]|nr:HDIG domain-containing protein [Cyanobacteria bacterium SIG31]
MQKFLDIISSKKFRNIFCFIVFTVLMTTAISSQNFFFQKVIENGISKRDIVAQKDIKVIDTKKTELHKKEVAQSVEPILTQAEDDFIMSSLEMLHKTVVKIREKKVSDEIKADELTILFDESERRGLIEFMIKSSNNDLNTIFDKSKIVLANVLNTGISAKDFDNNNVSAIIRRNIPNTTPRIQMNLITGVLNQVIVPNLVVDEFATEIAKKNAQNAVKPYEVVFKKGQKIVFEGEPVTKLKSDALRAAGYNVLEVNFGGIIGIYILVAFFTLTFLLYEKNFEKQYYNAKYLVLMSSFTLALAFVATVLPTGFSPYILPIPAYTILLSIFTTPRNAFFASTIVLALLAIGMHYNIETVVSFMLLNTVVMTAISKLKFSKRSDLLITSLKITLAGVLLVGGIYFLEKYMMDINNLMIARDLGYLVLNCFVISGVVILGVLPIIENMFRIMTPYGLAELADHNQPLLKKLLSDAPGTFNHSLIVSHLAEAAAEAIGANPVLARVGTMYHDIGKLLRPMFFVENQSFYGIENPHKTCTPRFSKMLITAHPKDGIELAKEYHLPQVIHNFILQHHGTSLVSYFYNEAIKEEGEDNVKEEQFRYPGPKPNMKETAILMIADAVESAVRAAKNPSNEEIDAIIQKIIKERLNDGQLEDSPLTLKDLKTIAETFSRMLRGMHHKRIKYHNDLVQELDKNNKQLIIPTIEEAMPALDADLESKIKELESKKNDNN